VSREIDHVAGHGRHGERVAEGRQALGMGVDEGLLARAEAVERRVGAGGLAGGRRSGQAKPAPEACANGAVPLVVGEEARDEGPGGYEARGDGPKTRADAGFETVHSVEDLLRSRVVGGVAPAGPRQKRERPGDEAPENGSPGSLALHQWNPMAALTVWRRAFFPSAAVKRYSRFRDCPAEIRTSTPAAAWPAISMFP